VTGSLDQPSDEPIDPVRAIGTIRELSGEGVRSFESGLTGHGRQRTQSKGSAVTGSLSVVSLVREYALRLRKPSAVSVSVLVVDDEEPVRKFVGRVLRNAGYQVIVASDGPEALQVAESLDSLDIVVSDLMMPQMNGDDLARRLRQDRPEVKILYLTGFSDNLFKERVMLWEDEAYLDKPCSIKSLMQAVSLLVFGTAEAPPELKLNVG
jgi:CheY-like chemotaxis protein